MTAYRLHCFPESGGCYKVALMLALCGEPFERVWLDYQGGEQRTPAWRARVNAMGEVPALEHGGRIHTQSGAILHYLAGQTGRFGGETSEEREEVLRWILFDNHKFTSYFATYRWLHHFTPGADVAVKAFLKARVESAFAVVEAHLAHHAFMLGARPTIADISMAGYHFFPAEETGFDLAASHPNIAAWKQRIAALPGWQPAYALLDGPRWVRG